MSILKTLVPTYIFCDTYPKKYFFTHWYILPMFTVVYRVIKRFFCNICRENPIIFTNFREIPADIAEKNP